MIHEKEGAHADSGTVREGNRRVVSDRHKLAGTDDSTWSGEEVRQQGRLLGDSRSSVEDGATEARQTKEESVHQLNPLSLPYVMMSEMDYLPNTSGVYFAIDELGQVAYIGRSANIRQRWRAHHVQGDLCDLSDLNSARCVRIAWLAITDVQSIESLERTLIQRFRPRLNKTHVKPQKEAKPDAIEITIKLCIDEMLKKRGRTAYWLSLETKISQGLLGRMKRGETSGIKWDTLERICDALECEPGDLIVNVSGKKVKAKQK